MTFDLIGHLVPKIILENLTFYNIIWQKNPPDLATDGIECAKKYKIKITHKSAYKIFVTRIDICKKFNSLIAFLLD